MRPPTGGETFVYRAASEASPDLQVEVGGTVQRLNSTLHIEIGRQLTYTFGHPDEAAPEDRFREIISSDGAVLQRIALCMYSPEENSDCEFPGALVVFGGKKLRGGLGAARFWNAPVSMARAGDGPGAGMVDRFKTDSPPEVRGRINTSDCFQQTFQVVNDSNRFATIEDLTVSGVVLCPSVGLPVAFQLLHGEYYILDDFETAGGPDESNIGPKKQPASSLISYQRWEAPLLVHDPTDTVELTVPEAHREALNRSAPYAEFFETYPDAIVAETWYEVRGRGETQVPKVTSISNREEYHRSLTAFSGNGKSIRIGIAKNVSEDEVTSQTRREYHVTSVSNETREAAVPTPDSVLSERATIESVAQVGENLIGSSQSRWLGPSLRTAIPGHAWYPFDESALKSNGYTITTYHPGAQIQSGALSGTVQYLNVVDGPSGEILWLNVNRTRLPLDGSHLS